MKTQAGSHRISLAMRYWHSAKLIIDNQKSDFEHMEPTAHLLAMTAELAMKAYLTDRGLTDAQLRSGKLGHNLKACLLKCLEQGLVLSELEGRAVISLSHQHGTHANRYGPVSVNGRLAIGAFMTVAESAVLAALAEMLDRISGEPEKLRNRHGHEKAFEIPQTLPVLSPLSPKRFSELEKEEADKLKVIDNVNQDLRKRGSYPVMGDK